MARTKYTELANAKIADTRKLVISKCEIDNVENGFTLAQQIEIDEGKSITKVFLKNAIHLDSIDSVYNLRDALNEAITKYELENNWDKE